MTDACPMRYALLALALFVTGCASGPSDEPNHTPSASQDTVEIETVCTMEMRAGLVIFVRDSETRDYIREGVRGIAREGDFADTLSFGYGAGFTPGEQASYLIGLYERPGVYTVTVRHPDYQTWRRDSVEILEDECHVILRSLEAHLEPIS